MVWGFFFLPASPGSWDSGIYVYIHINMYIFAYIYIFIFLYIYIYLYLYLYDESCSCNILWESTNIVMIVPQKKMSSPTFVGTASNSSSGTLSRHSLTVKTSPVWIFWLSRPRENAKNLVVYEWPDPFPRFGDCFLISVFYRTYWPIGPFTAIAFWP